MAEARKEARREVFSLYFSELVTAIQGDILSITNGCLSKKLITPAIHSGISESTEASGKKATKLLTAIGGCMEHQEGCFNKFLDLLKNSGIFDDLTTKLTTSLGEVITRKIAVECTDEPYSSERSKKSVNAHKEIDVLNLQVRAASSSPIGMMLARRTVIRQYLLELKTSVRLIIAPVASQCLTKKLISHETYRKVINCKSQKPIQQRTKKLLLNVCYCVRSDGKKFEVFMAILEKHRNCKGLVEKIQRDVKALREGRKSELVVPQYKQQDMAPVTSTPNLHQRKKECAKACANEIDMPVAVSEGTRHGENRNFLFGANTVSTPKVPSLTLDPQRDREYHLIQDRKQNEALMEDLRKKEEVSQKEKKELQDSVTELEKRVREKDEEIEHLKGNKADAQHAMNSLKVKVSFAEKVQHESNDKHTKALKDRLIQLEGKIAELENEKGELQNQVECLQKSLEEVKGSQANLESALRDTQDSLNSSKESLKGTEENLKCTEENLKCTEERLKCTEERLSITATMFQQAARNLNYVAYCIVVVGIVIVILFLAR